MTQTLDPGKDCVIAWDAMPSALQGSLAPALAGWLDAHLAECPACRAQFDKERHLQRAIRLPPAVRPDADAGLQRLLERIDRPGAAAPARARAGGWGARALVAAVLVQAVGLGVMGARLWSLEPAPAADYRTYTAEAAAPVAGSIRLVPDPAMRVSDWDALLRDNGLEVVAGPNAVGAYTVVPASGAAGREALVRRLRAVDGIRFAEPVADTP